jgi:hypothetical protein
MSGRDSRRYMGAKPGFGKGKLGTMCVYLCPNILATIFYGIPRVVAEPSMVVQL